MILMPAKLYNMGSWMGTLIGAVCWTQIYDIAFAILGIISIIFSIICSVLNIIYRIKKAREDGKITADEVKDIMDAVQDAQDNLDDKIKK